MGTTSRRWRAGADFFSHRFENEANWKFHEATTGPEIIADFKASGKKLTHWVTGYGTGGTFHGTDLCGDTREKGPRDR